MDLDIVYHINDARQFWAELEDILQVSASSTLTLLDSALRNFVSFCATYHEQYLQTPVQLEHACLLLLDSETFNCHSSRLSSLLISDALTNTDPHAQLILHHCLLLHGRRHPAFLRAPKKWAELIPLLMDHILLVDVDCEWYASGSSNAWRGGIGVPIEARLRTLAVRILYEVCRVQKFDAAALRIFTDTFIDQLFELVEATRDMTDETLNYCLIMLIVALNEQFMVSGLHPKDDANHAPNSDNCVIQVLMRRLGSSKTFGENLIFMLNRADHSAEDKCMQLLVLKILYLLFTTSGTQEYFYTNDLHVLVDVFIRELGDLDEDSESLRHTYLRVLHPLLTHTQLRTTPYKRPQILRTLENLVAHAAIRDVSPTTRRLVDRCLGGAWAKEEMERRGKDAPREKESKREKDRDHKNVLLAAPQPHPLRDLKFSKSVDVLPPPAVRKTRRPPVPPERRGSGESALSLVSVARAPVSGHARGATSPTQPNRLAASTSPPSPAHTYGLEKGRTRASSSALYEAQRLSGPPPPSPLRPSTFSDPPSPNTPFATDTDTDPAEHTHSAFATPTVPTPRYRPAPAPPKPRRPPVPSRSTKAGAGAGIKTIRVGVQ